MVLVSFRTLHVGTVNTIHTDDGTGCPATRLYQSARQRCAPAGLASDVPHEPQIIPIRQRGWTDRAARPPKKCTEDATDRQHRASPAKLYIWSSAVATINDYHQSANRRRNRSPRGEYHPNKGKEVSNWTRNEHNALVNRYPAAKKHGTIRSLYWPFVSR